ncbi:MULTISPECIES: trypsin-like peptidase domain-containing protein [Rhodonellum]|uniref:Do/DeqQ family serine protease n=1 Tax=Rhodonellum ikkaensis TaxID=336829 RepID=A0A1H3R422_9BACT|nr:MULTISPECIES: trypsin-like peptidase domain-containing protein [Rhodonellum]SDZ20582.1 Do/DeqQ family serine protease [Rhodonellum ikkaensis]
MRRFRKINFLALIVSLFLLFFVFQACQAQENKNEKDIEAIQKSAEIVTEKINYSGIVDFRMAAKIATPGVVNIRSTFNPQNQESREEDRFYNIPDPFRDFFKDDPFFREFRFQFPESPRFNPDTLIGSGSGVILTPDGYIITNHHVVKNADEINITLFDGRSYTASVIGNDPQTDLSLLKIEEKGLSFIRYGESDILEVGEWVVAVGNPFNLASTVTAGIVSAKARNINILTDQGAVESFIQTDAAVNRGNSGGALVTLDGKLVGINTAIATPTGVYAGYAFAIPVDIVKKVANDLMNYGTVKRGVLGIMIRNMNSTLARELKMDRANGVYVDSVMLNSAAKNAGLKEKDVIIGIDGVETLSAASLQELIMRKRPGEKVKISLIRNGVEHIELVATLKEQERTTDTAISKNVDLLKDLGVELAEINEEDRKRYDVKSGLKIIKLFDGKLKRNTSIREGFVITSINNKAVTTLQSFLQAIEGQKGGIMLEGKYAGDPTYYYYAFGL